MSVRLFQRRSPTCCQPLAHSLFVEGWVLEASEFLIRWYALLRQSPSKGAVETAVVESLANLLELAHPRRRYLLPLPLPSPLLPVPTCYLDLPISQSSLFSASQKMLVENLQTPTGLPDWCPYTRYPRTHPFFAGQLRRCDGAFRLWSGL
ncbi:hypothetical protein F4780DRAFT_723318 [Xylariomycetidae sp. FL0641]|nr:hypothetical protein F4780DRAFT_723318 [Xylariomycetidae sp. FL0641]